MQKDDQYYQWLKSQPIDNLALENVAEMWYYEMHGRIPVKNTEEYEKMYNDWVSYAFADFQN